MGFMFLKQSIAQKEGYNGIFGLGGVGLSFNTIPPTVLNPVYPGKKFATREGSAAISDRDGNLLFYTNGYTAWNRNNVVMSNGDELITGEGAATVLTTTQIIIVPIPKDPFLYYIFIPHYQGRDFKYALVDMRLNAGLGDVVFKDRLLYKRSTEKVCTIKHATDSALWLITHEFGNDAFRTYYIDEKGIDTTNYIRSRSGQVIDCSTGYCAMGYMKPNLNGDKLAFVNFEFGTVELYQFNKANGQVHSPQLVHSLSLSAPYGVEFSPDGSKLYYTDAAPPGQLDKVYQYNLNTGIETVLAEREPDIAKAFRWTALQLAPDGKIYISTAKYDGISKRLDRINYPDLDGAACGFEQNALQLGGETFFGLPEFNIRMIRPEITFNNPCSSQITTFSLINTKSVAAIHWNFGDPDSGSQNTSTQPKPVHRFAHTGEYNVTVDVTFVDNSGFSFSKKVTVYNGTVDLGADTEVCFGTTLKLSAFTPGEFVSYQWQDGSTDSLLYASKEGWYWVEMQDYICNDTDSIYVSLIPQITTDLGNDSTICNGKPLTFEFPYTFTTYAWQDGSTDNKFVATKTGKYYVSMINKCESFSDTVLLHFYNPETFFLPNVITPNGDEFNDRFIVDQVLVGSTFSVFDRWGKSIYINRNYDNTWPQSSGTAESGVFYYELSGICPNQRVKGVLQLIK